MLNELIEIFDKYEFEYKLALNISYSIIVDWCIEIKQNNNTIFVTQNCDLNTCTAKTYIFLTEWLEKNNGGY